jgi:N-acetylneuraminate synthase/N,N'-diacetyllegionaminate synthase
MPGFAIGPRQVGDGQPVFFVAEAGVNHDGSIDTAMALVDAAASAGADAVKFQIFRTELVISPDAPKAAYQLERDPGISLFEMVQELELEPEAFRILVDHCRERSIRFLATPFDEESADVLEALDVGAFKIGSGELTNHPFLEHVARNGRPMIVSTGMSTMGEVEAAVDVIASAGDPPLALLHAVSNYPADPHDVNLRAMSALQERFGVPVGYSDHTLGIAVALAAVALGATMIEKHITLDRTRPGPDHAASIEPSELAELVRGARAVESALGTGVKAPAESEGPMRLIARRSLVLSRSKVGGEEITAADLVSLRPGDGISPSDTSAVIGRRLMRDMPAGSLLAWEDLG